MADSLADTVIDTTPTIGKPPSQLIQAAGRVIPLLMANVSPRQDGIVILPASDLAKRLQGAGHALAAAQWAMHSAIQSGQLKPCPREHTVFVSTPRDITGAVPGRHCVGASASYMRREAVAIPRGRPAPFDAFCVQATESLWKWWRECEGGGNDHQSAAEPAISTREAGARCSTQTAAHFAAEIERRAKAGAFDGQTLIDGSSVVTVVTWILEFKAAIENLMQALIDSLQSHKTALAARLQRPTDMQALIGSPPSQDSAQVAAKIDRILECIESAASRLKGMTELYRERLEKHLIAFEFVLKRGKRVPMPGSAEFHMDRFLEWRESCQIALDDCADAYREYVTFVSTVVIDLDGAGTKVSGRAADAEGDFHKLAELVGDSTAAEIARVATSCESVDARLRKIIQLDRRFAGKTSQELATLLSVKDSSAVRQTDAWKQRNELAGERD